MCRFSLLFLIGLLLQSLTVEATEQTNALVRKSDGQIVGVGTSEFETYDTTLYEVKPLHEADIQDAHQAIQQELLAQERQAEAARQQREQEQHDEEREIPLKDFGVVAGGIAGAASLVVVARKKKAA